MKAIALKPEESFVEDIHHQNDLYHIFSDNSVWNAFKSGMHILCRYSNRMEADTSQIIRANLRLLHRTLINDSAYRHALKLANEEAYANEVTPTLIATPDLSAKLVSIKKGCESLFVSDSNSLVMALVVSGKAIISHPDQPAGKNNQSRRLFKWLQWSNSPAIQGLKKEGDLILFNSCAKETKSLTANTKDCVLLKIKLPAQEN